MAFGKCESCQTLRELLTASEQRSADLLSKYHELRLAGANPAVKPQFMPAQPPSKVEEAITERAGANGALRRHLSRWAASQQAAGKTDAEIVKAVTVWNSGAEADD